MPNTLDGKEHALVAIGRIPGVMTTQKEKVANVWLIP